MEKTLRQCKMLWHSINKPIETFARTAARAAY